MQITSRLTMAAHMVSAIDYFKDMQPVTSSFLAKSIGTSPVMVRTIMGMLKEAGIISSSKGKRGIDLARPLKDITLLDLWRAVDTTEADSLFHFHESPSPLCPVGRNIHAILDDKFSDIQRAMEAEMRKYTLEDIHRDLERINVLQEESHSV